MQLGSARAPRPDRAVAGTVCTRCGERFTELAPYLVHGCTAAPPANGSGAAHAGASPTAADAADSAARSDNPILSRRHRAIDVALYEEAHQGGRGAARIWGRHVVDLVREDHERRTAHVPELDASAAPPHRITGVIHAGDDVARRADWRAVAQQFHSVREQLIDAGILTPGELRGRPPMTILDAVHDRALFGRWFDVATWRAWFAFLAARLRAAARATTPWPPTSATPAGSSPRPAPPARPGWWPAAAAASRGSPPWSRSTSPASAITPPILAPGEVGTVAIIAADRRQARTIMRYVNGFLDAVPMLSKMVEARTAESVTLTNRIVIEVHTASWRTLRGYTVVAAVCDEIAFWRTDDSANPDHEILAGLRPSMATVPGALLLAISSPYAHRGALYDAHRKHYGRDGDPVLVWQAETRAMNPTVGEQTVADAYADDSAAARTEYGAEFRADLESFIDIDTLRACVVADRVELPPASAVCRTSPRVTPPAVRGGTASRRASRITPGRDGRDRSTGRDSAAIQPRCCRCAIAPRCAPTESPPSPAIGSAASGSRSGFAATGSDV